jgi:hypothetical protein
LDWNFLKKCLTKYDFGDNFIKMINTIYNNIESCVINNGISTEWFKLERGVRQGCPVSPYLFILAVEVLASNIRNTKNIRGIKVNNIEIKLSLLTDNLVCFVTDLISVENCISLLNNFEKCSGLRVNIAKTKAIPIGTLKETIYEGYGLDWSERNVSTLGVILTGNEHDHYKLNYGPRILKIKNILEQWSCHNLSLKGRITIVNNLVMPSLLYLANTIYTDEAAF